jgi:hypothetical protein
MDDRRQAKPGGHVRRDDALKAAQKCFWLARTKRIRIMVNPIRSEIRALGQRVIGPSEGTTRY